MLKIIGEFSGQADRGADTYDLDDTISLAVKKVRKRKSVLIILCGEVIENYDEYLNQLAMKLYNLGLVDDTNIERREILPIFNSHEKINDIVRKIRDISNKEKKIIYLKGFHQYEYNKVITSQLLDGLLLLLKNNQIDAPIVLNIPMVVKQEFMELYSDIWKNSIRYINRKSQTNVYQQGGASAFDYVPDYSRKETDSRLSPRSKKIIEESQGKKSIRMREDDEKYPWYTKDLELLKQEKDGMVMLLKNSNYQFEIAALPKSKRLNWYLRLVMTANGLEYNLSLRLVYSKSFSKDNPTVGLVVENSNEKLTRAISRNRCCEDVITTDSEFEKVFIIKPIKRRNNDSVAAATLEGFVSLINSINHNELI